MSGHDEWINSGINVAWLSRRIPDDLPDAFDQAWDELQVEPAWRRWITLHHTAVKGNDVFNYLEVGDADAVKISHRRGGDLVYVVPVTYFEGADWRQRSRALIHDLYAARAERAHVEPPPPV
ncbi:hypothetical protein [Nocardioides sp. cx-173]|uniref:hypothetical protein n=1 Tax=Nocardioides sp. cx-173 TaxID=2898796 RepID=UPI001E41C472|nr:hypothetical protein [Nocardioides sp. cx-173]MCD4525119.1 hypothetical protein [Nocardioides sp. cx-173]UGB40178.1 hypothetical protein LQ940_12330 [Nocardioides sp. cx-173]